MYSVQVNYPQEWESANLYVLSDWHLGDLHADRAAIEAQVNRIAEDPHGLCVLNGDLLNTAVKNSPSDIYGEVLKPMEQIVDLVTLLSPIKKKIVAATTGNHEARVYRNDGVDVMRLVCRELGCENRYCADGIVVFLRFGKAAKHGKGTGHRPDRLFILYATHGAGGGRKEGAKAIRLADMAAVVDADIYIHSHSHLPMILRESYYRTCPQNCTVTAVDKLFVNTASALQYGGYGQALEYKPNSLQTPVIHLDPWRGQATATL